MFTCVIQIPFVPSIKYVSPHGAGGLMLGVENIQFIVELFVPFVILMRSRRTSSHLDEPRAVTAN